MMLISVDLPAPLGPSNAKNSPRRISKLMPRRASSCPYRLRIPQIARRSEEHTSELQSLMRISYAVFCLKKKITYIRNTSHYTTYHPTIHHAQTSTSTQY